MSNMAEAVLWYGNVIDDVTAETGSKMSPEVYRATLSAHIQPNATVRMDNDLLKSCKWISPQWPSQLPD